MEEKVIAELNAEFGCNLGDLSKSKILVDKYVNQLNAIEEKVKKKLSFGLFTLIFTISIINF